MKSSVVKEDEICNIVVEAWNQLDIDVRTEIYVGIKTEWCPAIFVDQSNTVRDRISEAMSELFE